MKQEPIVEVSSDASDDYLAWQAALEDFKSAKQAKVPPEDLKRLGYLAYRRYLIYLANEKDYVGSLISVFYPPPRAFGSGEGPRP